MSNVLPRHGLPLATSSSSNEAASTTPAVLTPTEATTTLPRVNAPVAHGDLTSSNSRVKKRILSKTKLGSHLSRSASSPQLKGSVMSESELDKKRNKLGYQRISIACGHCRRRKIRCLVAEGDPQNRCQNCIRLKKECIFYPVDQQGVMESRSQSTGKPGLGSGPPSAVSPSPPDLGSGRPFERARQFGSYPSLDHGAPLEPQAIQLAPGSTLAGEVPFKPGYSFANTSQATDPGRDSPVGYGYQPQEVVSQHWNASEDFGSSRSSTTQADGSVDAHPPYWQPHQSPMGSNYAAFPANGAMVGQANPGPRSYSYPSHHDQAGWTGGDAPMRPVQYAPSGGLPTGFLPSNAGFAPQMSQQQGSVHYGPPVDVQGGSNISHMQIPNSAPAGLAIMNSYGQQGSYIYQSPQPPSSGASLPGPPAYQGSWYGEPHSYAQGDNDKPHITRPHP